MLDTMRMKRELMAMTGRPRTPGWDGRMRSDLIALLVGTTPGEELQTVRFHEWMCRYVDSFPLYRQPEPLKAEPFVGNAGK